MPKADRFLPLGRVDLVNLFKQIYNLIPEKLRIYIQKTEINFYLYTVYSFLISYTQKFYSQTGKDKLLSIYLPELNGRYIDVGAGQPVRGSNTYYFYKRSWSGILIDPLRFNQKLNHIFRKRDIKLEGLIANQNEFLDFYEFYPGEYSTTVKKVADNLVERNIKLKNTYKVRCLPLSSLNILMNPTEPSLLSIDVEGMDLNVLKSNNWKKITPRVICVEEDAQINSQSEISKYLKTVGYKYIDSTGLSSIYVHEEYVLK
jgi:FkbM family methyltransferase